MERQVWKKYKTFVTEHDNLGRVDNGRLVPAVRTRRLKELTKPITTSKEQSLIPVGITEIKIKRARFHGTLVYGVETPLARVSLTPVFDTRRRGERGGGTSKEALRRSKKKIKLKALHLQ